MMDMPKEIFLQVIDDDDIKIERLDEATWCSDKIYDTDVKYIRADVECDCPYCDSEFKPLFSFQVLRGYE